MVSHLSVLSVWLIVILIASGAKLSKCERTFTIVNGCKDMVWPGISPGGGNNSVGGGGGFALKPGESKVHTVPDGWAGRIWGRTGCGFDKNGSGTCQTGSCGTSLNCTGPGKPPTSIADFALGTLDYYDVSLVDGFNLPIVIAPEKGKGNCSKAGCDKDLRENCPPELAMKTDGEVTACRSACNVFNTDEYCCRGAYENTAACQPSNYSKVFKEACPAAYSYAYDAPTSVFTCTGPDYTVTFCTSRNQTVCAYHNNRLACNGSKALKAVSQRWWVLIVLLPLLTTLQSKHY